MVVRMTEVVPVEVDNKPGGLARALAAIEDAGLGVEYMYDFGAASRAARRRSSSASRTRTRPWQAPADGGAALPK
jgi:hypothetical protein